LEEHELTDKQRKWLEASKKIGRIAMTKSEKQTLERLYSDMLPREQQDLASYIEEKFGKKDQSGKEAPEAQDPIEKMLSKEWREPSKGLLTALSKIRSDSIRKK
jgi:hypothetical protein